MEQAEIELLVGELESRLDRLRVLYEQYFMGFERVEPHVPKKDVERRVAVLRKEQIRNTGLRFKFQMILQRYSTYQTYWFRIARQIEFGTYKRDVMRATARFGIDPTREQAADDAEAPTRERELVAAAGPAAAPRQNEITEEEMAELEDGSAFLEPLDAEDDPFASITVSAAAEPAKRPAQAPPERFASTVRLELDDGDDPFEEHDPFPKPAAPSAPKIRIAPRPGAATSVPVPAILAIDDHRDTERKIPAAPRVIVSKRAPPLEGGSVPAPPPLRVGVGVAVAPATPSAAPRTAVVVPTAPPSRPQVAPAPGSPAVSRPPQAAPAAAALSRPPVAAPAPPVAPGQRAAPVIRPATPARAAPVSPAVQAAAPPPAAAPARAPVIVAPRAAPAPTPSAAPVAPARGVGDLTGDRFGQIYSKYVETRRGQNEPTHAITRDALAKQLAESTERLKQKHAGKAIDFEVVVKEGKTILRPVVK